ncbi:hypothetical protein QR680_005698 [Steinernema hermaphroditum]|uniref:G-protein coupled receptors family 1 profile domain-containing protein n=1 Tax=Steinernema hermaphroditum TaxID=289476 RepID=A0AA39HT28_9BILA|nr:hypothetical protein QR680_005698 [Steinernema hermaphroditum]
MAENASLDVLEAVDRCHDVAVEYIDQRFWLVAIFGSLISVVSVVENAFLFCVFITSRHHRNSHSLYLLLLAFFDVFMSVSFLMLMSVRVFFNYTESVYLKNLWMSYVVPMMAVSHIAMTTSSFLIVFATVERFAITKSSAYVYFLQSHRKWIALLGVFLGVLSKVTIAFELKVERDPKCLGAFNEFYLTVTSLVRDNRHYVFWRFWYRNLITILLPFFVLMAMNAQIVNELRKQAYDPLTSHFIDHQRQASHAKQRKAGTPIFRPSTCPVLGENPLGYTHPRAHCRHLLAGERPQRYHHHLGAHRRGRSDLPVGLHSSSLTCLCRYTQFYIISVDAVSLLTIVACALRLPIYWGCQPLLRIEMEHFVRQLLKGHARKILDRRITVYDPSAMALRGNLALGRRHSLQVLHILVPLLLLLPFVAPTNLSEFHCGSSLWQKITAQITLGRMCPRHFDGANACCLEHDQCYNRLRGRPKCDVAFCECLEQKLVSSTECLLLGNWMCHLADAFGGHYYDQQSAP